MSEFAKESLSKEVDPVVVSAESESKTNGVEATTAATPAAPAIEAIANAETTPAVLGETKVVELVPVAAVPALPEPVTTTETVEKVVDEFENMTIFGNKSLDELHKIQSKKSHLSAGRVFLP